MSEHAPRFLQRLSKAEGEEVLDLAAAHLGKLDREAISFLNDDPTDPHSLVLEESQLLLRRDEAGRWAVVARIEEWIVRPGASSRDLPAYLRQEGMDLMDLYPPVEASAQYLVDNSGAVHFTEAKTAVCWASDLLAMLFEHSILGVIGVALSLRAGDCGIWREERLLHAPEEEAWR